MSLFQERKNIFAYKPAVIDYRHVNIQMHAPQQRSILIFHLFQLLYLSLVKKKNGMLLFGCDRFETRWPDVHRLDICMTLVVVGQ